ncbi:MAG: hypothetical protein JXR34_08565 [Bacteroidales bacterium]|nr:hypothetical protein [Bacteroidales bacterium]
MKRFSTIFIFLMILFISENTQAQMRYGNCGSAPSDRFYITPYLGAGFATYKGLNFKDNTFTWLGGITFNYRLFDKVKLGLGTRYQEYTKPNYHHLKPYLNAEFSLYFTEFEDFGLYINAGPAFDIDIIDVSGIFVDGGIYYNYIVSPNSGLVFMLDYSHNKLNFPSGLSVSDFKINEFKLLIGYRFWF